MTVSAKRRGIDQDPERELRFRRIEQELDARALANNQTAASAQRRGKTSVPQVSGLSLDNSIVGGIGVKWSAVDIPDVQKYQLQYSADNNFLSATTVTIYNTHYNLPDASAETTYYVRVRAFNSTGASGNWSSTLNAQTGQASVSNLADGSASSIVVVSKTAGFSPATVDGAGTTVGRYLRRVINFPVAAETLLIGLCKGTMTLNNNETLYVRLKVDGQTKVEYENKPTGGVASVGVLTVPGLSVPVLIPSGQHEFVIEVEADGTSTYAPSEASLAIWQVRK
jgi:hypothetical protein